jgi:N-acetylglucosaminyldiphosphoundecaprenol N-acetyl-beta-D-mannosaminyltransferase
VLLALCQRTAGQNVQHFFFGGLPGVADRLAETLTGQFPGLRIVGTECPPVADVGSTLDKALVERLNASGAQVIWVGLGSPKQDLWMALYRPHLTAPLLIGVGAAFDFLSGTKRQAPRWMRRSGLEWVFRLVQEPRRLWKRYLVYNTLFVWQIMRQKAE